MISVRYNPKLIGDEGQRRSTIPFLDGMAVGYYLDIAGFSPKGMRIIVSGAVRDLDHVVLEGDEITLAPDIGFDPVTGAFSWIALGHLIFSAVVTMAVSYAVSYAINAMFARKPNNNTNGQGIDESSTTYSWDGIRTTQDVGTAVPVVYGEHKVGGNVVNSFVNDDGDNSYLNTLLALCEGEIDSILSVEVNNNDISNYTGITYSSVMGTNTQSPIANFEMLHDVFSVSQTLLQNVAHTYTMVQTTATGFDIYLTFPNGLYQADTQGNVLAWQQDIKIEYKKHADPTYTLDGTHSVNYCSRTSLSRIFSVRGLPAGQYDVKITKTSIDSTLSPVKTGDVVWSSIDEITNDDLSYPNTALIGIQALATSQLSGSTPNFGIVLRGKKISIPDVKQGGVSVAWSDYYFDPSTSLYRKLSDGSTCTWDGTTYITAWSANPVWCLMDFLTNTRYGMGQFIDSSMINLPSFLTMSQYCENQVPNGLGGYEKRLRLDIVLDTTTRALDALLQIANTFRGMLLYSNGTLKLKIDKPDVPVQLFGMGNIIQDSFQQSWLAVKDRYNVIQAQFLDKTQDYVMEKIAVSDDVALASGDPMRMQDIKIFTTSITQAYREARFFLWKNKYLKRSVSFKAGIEAICCEAGDVINVSHDIPQWGFSGRLVSGTASTVVLDQPVTILAGHTYKIMVRQSDDTIEEKTVTTGAGTGITTLSISGNFTKTPIGREPYSFGETTIETKPFRVLNMKANNDFTVEITAMEYNAGIYDDTAPAIPDTNYSALSFAIAPVSNVVLSEKFMVGADGSLSSGIDVWFDKPDTTTAGSLYSKARIFLSDDGGLSWQFLGETYGATYQIRVPLVVGHAYRVAIASVTATGDSIPVPNSPYANITLTGTAPAPASVAGFSYSWGDVLTLLWIPNTEKDIAGYEIRDLDSNFGTADSHQIYKGLANTKVLFPVGRTVGTYYIRAFNRSGGYSASSVSITPTVTAPSAPTGLSADVLFNLAKAYWTDTGGTNNLYYEVWKSYTNAWAGEQVLVTKASGKSCDLISKNPRSGTAQSGSVTTLADPSLIGFGDGYFVGGTLTIIEGAGAGQSMTITGFTDATGTLTFGTQAIALDATSQYNITDNVYIKVRGVDQYGVGSFSSALYVQFQNLSENMFGDNVITARKIYVACLSALSANLGCVTAGVLQGATIQTASGGARTVIDTVGLHSYDASCCLLTDISCGTFCLATACSGARQVINSQGFYAYDAGGCQVMSICNGCINAQSIQLNDPACCCNYSYLCSGRLRFHDILGDVPYMTRICSGVVATGGIVCLLGWTSVPSVIVGIRNLQSFNSVAPSSCQSWAIFNDTPVCYINSTTDYGYCFTAHACLTTSASQGAVCTRALAFGTACCGGIAGVCYLSANSVCAVCVRHQFQLWRNSACGNYYYGCLCYDICYRVNGSGTWCKCSFTYIQPHGSVADLQTTNDVYDMVNLPCSACWQFVSCMTGMSIGDSGISSASIVCCLCTRNLCCGTTIQGCVCGIPSNCTCTCCVSCHPVFGGVVPSNLWCSYVCYCVCSITNLMIYADGSTILADSCYGCANALYNLTFGTGRSYDKSCCIYYGTSCGSCCCCIPITAIGGCISFGSCNLSCVCFNGVAQGYVKCAFNTARACFDMCLFCGTLYQCYCAFTGVCGCCLYMCVCTTQDTFGASCVLDPAGCLNWLAIAY